MTRPNMRIKVGRMPHDIRIWGRIVKVRSTKQFVRHLLILISLKCNDRKVINHLVPALMWCYVWIRMEEIMDNNQRQDWWPNNDKAPETDTSSGAEVHDSVQPHPEPDPVPRQIPEESGTEPETVPQENSYNTWNNPQGQSQDNPYNNWNNQQGQYQNNPYNNWNNQQGQYQNNPYNNWNNQQGQYQNTPYNNTPNRPPMRSNNGMAIASLVMGVLSIALICCGFSYFFGALGILFAILSRKNGPMDPQAKVGLGLSIGGTVVGLLMILFVLFGSTEYSDFMQEYERFYNEYEDDYDSYDDPYYDDYYGEDFYFDGPFQNLPNQGDWNMETPDEGSSL